MRYNAVVAVASSTAPGVFETRMPRQRDRIAYQNEIGAPMIEQISWRSPTFLFAGQHVNEIVACPVMRDPLHTRRQSFDQITIKNPDSCCRDITPVDPDGTLIRPTRLEASKELGAIWCIVHLCLRPSARTTLFRRRGTRTDAQ